MVLAYTLTHGIWHLLPDRLEECGCLRDGKSCLIEGPPRVLRTTCLIALQRRTAPQYYATDLDRLHGNKPHDRE